MDRKLSVDHGTGPGAGGFQVAGFVCAVDDRVVLTFTEVSKLKGTVGFDRLGIPPDSVLIRRVQEQRQSAKVIRFVSIPYHSTTNVERGCNCQYEAIHIRACKFQFVAKGMPDSLVRIGVIHVNVILPRGNSVEREGPIRAETFESAPGDGREIRATGNEGDVCAPSSGISRKIKDFAADRIHGG